MQMEMEGLRERERWEEGKCGRNKSEKREIDR